MTHLTHPRSLLVSLSLGAVVAAGTALVPSAAHAKGVTVVDATGDAVTISDGGEEATPAPRARSVDAVRTRVDHRARTLVVRITTVRGAKNVQPVVRVKGGGRDSYFFALRGKVLGDRGCEGGSFVRTTSTRTSTMKIPNRCFGAPSSVRVGAVLVRSDETGGPVVLDDVQKTGYDAEKGDIALGSALRRG